MKTCDQKGCNNPAIPDLKSTEAFCKPCYRLATADIFKAAEDGLKAIDIAEALAAKGTDEHRFPDK